ncbi:hypothetical protein ABZ570_06820 [Micromonospora sp. NPDC007271]|uniref:hypothetical protein n=1 Tax=Micromonospora sp. NPDC007271 TaxID=3154587 RepID=UPI003405E86A
MSRFRTALIVAAAALGASAVLPVTPASADTVDKFAHAMFNSNDDDTVSMTIDVAKVDGVTTIDVDWQQSRCALTETAYVCDSVYRMAYDAPVRNFSFSLTGETRVRADVTYRELRRHCTYVDEQEDCTEQEAAGSTTVEVTWTPTSEPTREVWTDEQGVRHVSKRIDASATGSGFGLTYGPAGSYGVVSRSRTIDPA